MEFLKKNIRDIPDFPKKGIIFKDITPLLNNPKAFKKVITEFEKILNDRKIDRVVAIESRGFIFGAALAEHLSAGLVIARKPGKLPYKTIKESFKLEYGDDALEIHADAIKPGEKVVIIDDVLATGGTMKAASTLVKKLGGDIQMILFLIELSFLKGKENLKLDGRQLPYSSLITY